MQPFIGGKIEPLARAGANVPEVLEVAPGQEVLLHVANGVSDPALFLRGAGIAGDDVKAAVAGDYQPGFGATIFEATGYVAKTVKGSKNRSVRER